jgi:pimeloyl-ACP methyl ester carboxylesterase
MSASRPRSATADTHRFISSDGVSIVAHVAGSEAAPTVVLMHGGGQTRHSWSGTFKLLVDVGYRVVSYDARGHGESGWSADGIYSYPLRAEDLRAVLADTRGPFALIGASMGGVTAMQAVGEGLRPAALVLVDIVLAPEKAGVERIRNFMLGNPDGFANLEAVVDAVAAYNPHRPRPRDTRGLMRNLREGPNGRLRWHWDPRILPPDADEDLSRIESVVKLFKARRHVPLLLVRGVQSDVLSDGNVAHFLETFPQAEVLDVAGAGHMVAGDSNDVFTQGIVEYLRRCLPLATE